MSYEFNEKHFESWLVGNKQLSKKAAGDVISRLKRTQKLVATEGYSDLASYSVELNKLLEASTIPESSQKSMMRAVKLYFQFSF